MALCLQFQRGILFPQPAGAPKKRAREIIAELEPSARGIYTGALGFFRADGRAAFSIAIRTLVVRDDRATYGVGAGIVADSDPVLEYEETLHKAAGLSAALRGVGWVAKGAEAR